MSGFDIFEIDVNEFRKLWIRGSFPRSYLSDDERKNGEILRWNYNWNNLRQ
ncbi:hypothetical protein GMMP15_140015 [Candidatus Magnetomoraceae bacterium gMMP-15]